MARGGLTNRPLDKETARNLAPKNPKPKSSGILSALASAIKRGAETRERNEIRRNSPAGGKSTFRTTNTVNKERAQNIKPLTFNASQMRGMLNKGFDPAARDAQGNIVNPYGSSGLRGLQRFPNLSQSQINEIYNKRVQRFNNPMAQNPTALKTKFGSMFRSSEGEPTIQGPLKKQQMEPTSTVDTIARLGASTLFSPFSPLLSMTDDRSTRMVPSGSKEYDPKLDPRNRNRGMFGGILDVLTGGAGQDAIQMIKNIGGKDEGVGSLEPETMLNTVENMNLAELNMDDFSNDSLRRILNRGLQSPGSLFGREQEIFEQMIKNQKLGIPNFAVDGPVTI